MDNSAVRPDKFFNLPVFSKENEAVESLTDDELAIASLANHSGWIALKAFIENCESDLDNVNTIAMANGAGFDEVGRNTVVISLTKGIIKKIKDKVTDAKEQAESNGGK